MNTTTAATQAGVTVATIRTWCRRNAIAATKVAGRWVIDADSLAYRIALARRKERPVPEIVINIDTLTKIGGRRWVSERGHDRIYLNEWHDLAGLDIAYYKTGNVSSATYRGEDVSNSQGTKLANCISKVWYDVHKREFTYSPGGPESRVATRDEVLAHVIEGVRTAIAARAAIAAL